MYTIIIINYGWTQIYKSGIQRIFVEHNLIELKWIQTDKQNDRLIVKTETELS